MSSTTRASRAPGAPSNTPPALIKITLGVVVAVMLAVVMCTQADSTTGSGRPPSEVLPADFPVVAGAQLVNGDQADPGGVVTLRASGTVADVVAFYGKELAAKGWTTEEWQGTDPYGDAAEGFIISKGDEAGALSVKAQGDRAVQIQVNMNQPVSPSEGGGHDMGGDAADG